MKGEDILAIDRFYAVIPLMSLMKMLAVIDDISSLTDFHIIIIVINFCAGRSDTAD